MDAESNDELRLITDDELSDIDENSIANNGQPIYGRDTAGSFGRTISCSDLDRFCLIVFKSNGEEIRLLNLLEVLTSTYRVNFISNISYKVKRNPLKSIVYVYASYSDEVFRFMNQIQSDVGASFLLGNVIVHARLFNNFVFGLAHSNAALRDDLDMIYNLHFNYVPHNSLSPSHNVLNILERALCRDRKSVV